VNKFAKGGNRGVVGVKASGLGNGKWSNLFDIPFVHFSFVFVCI
jgi:hypothetical protein